MTTSNQKRTVATKGTRHVAYAIMPDMCLPKGKKKAQPYQNWVESTKLARGATETARIGGQPIWTDIGELGPPSEPAHAGVDKGLVSKTYCAEATALSYSPDVVFEGHRAVRTDDLTAQNHANTVGRALERPADMTLQAYLIALGVAEFFGNAPWRNDIKIVKRGNVWVIVDKKNKVVVLLGTQQYRGPGASQAWVDAATRNINSVWSGTTVVDGETYQVRSLITGSVGDGSLRGANDIYVTTDNIRAWQMYYGRERWPFGEDYSGLQDTHDTGRSVAGHEFGHAMGLPDEYVDQKDAKGNVYSVPNHAGDVMADAGATSKPYFMPVVPP